MTVYMIRHGRTDGNRCGRYIGRTDEPILPEEASRLKGGCGKFGNPHCVYVSPLLRCRQTADVLFPDVPQIIIDELKECDFGLFENKTYEELKNLEEYRKWLKTNGTGPFPGGDDVGLFKQRCMTGFLGVVSGECLSAVGGERSQAERGEHLNAVREECPQVVREERSQAFGDHVVLVTHGGVIMSILESIEGSHDFYRWHCGNGEGFGVEWGDGGCGKVWKICC